MKLRKTELIIILITLLFISFTAGFFTGRGTAHSSITVETSKDHSAAPFVANSPQSSGQNSDDSENDAQDNFSDMVNINTADISRLTKLSGIGEVIAQRIIDYRTENGPFNSISDIMNVSGIGESVYEKIEKNITVD